MAQNNVAAGVSNIVELLRLRSTEGPDRLAYRFQEDASFATSTLTYRQLDRQARGIAARIQAAHPAGSRGLILYPSGLDCVAALFGCFYAGTVAVPLNLPRNTRSLHRLEAVVSDAAFDFILTRRDIWERLIRNLEVQTLGKLAVVITDEASSVSEQDWTEPHVTSASLAVLQYTSGSTANPKGVMISHGNIVSNLAQLVVRAELGVSSVGVSWLPLFHDMGLMGGVIAPLFAGFPVTLLSPASFLSRPLKWLQAITRYRATVSVAPNFAYELCLRNIQAEQLAELDLRTWEVAFSGAEPIRAETLERFAERFATCGFRRNAFFPCYGLAEATLFVSGGPKAVGPVTQRVDADAMEKAAIARPAIDEKRVRTLVASGRPIAENTVVIVDQLSRKPLSDKHIGEIWVRGEGVGCGYLNRREATDDTFSARLADSHEGPFLRTGDLGYLDDSCLYVVGRIKDLILIRGSNHYPQDIERSAEQAHSDLRADAGAAFSIEQAGEEQLVIVQEVERSARENLSEIIDAIRRKIADEHGVSVHAVVLVKRGTIPKTTSGKIQRRQTCMAFKNDTLAVVAQWRKKEHDPAQGMQVAATSEEAAEAEVGFGGPVLEDGEEQLAARTTSVVVIELARLLGVDEANIRLDERLSSLGLDSLKLFQWKGAIAARLGIDFDPVLLFEDHTIAALGRSIASGCRKRMIPQLTPRRPRSGALPLSLMQERLWLLEQLRPGEAVYNNSATVTLTGELNIDALDSSFQALLERHDALRTRFVVVDGCPIQVIEPSSPVPWTVLDLTALPEAARAQEVRRLSAQQAAMRFSLEVGPLLRVQLLKLDIREHVLLVTMHHMVSDGLSLEVLIRDIATTYVAVAAGQPSPLPALPVQYVDYAIWQREWLQGRVLDEQLSYWEARLAGAPAALDLPTDRVRPAVQSFEGDAHRFVFTKELTAAVTQLARAEAVTPFMVLLAAFKIVLSRLSGQTDIVVGTPTAGRHRGTEGLIGFFINMLALRTDLNGDLSLREVLRRVKDAALGAYANQDLPFEKLLEKLRPERTLTHTPLFQVVMNMLGPGEEIINLSGLKLRVSLEAGSASKFDLTLYARELDGCLQFNLVYNAHLFHPDRMKELAEQFREVAAQLASNPDEMMLAVPLVTARAAKILPDPAARLDDHWYGAVHQLFAARAAGHPDRTAVINDGLTLTYRQIDEASDQLATCLRDRGIEIGDVVAIYGHRSPPIVWAVLGILKAGAAFTILDPAYPDERLIACMQAVRPRAWLEIAGAGTPGEALLDSIVELACCCQLRLRGCEMVAAGRVITGKSAKTPDVPLGPDDLAVVTFTSGSTGKPKAIQGRHGPLSHFLPWLERTFGLDAFDRFSMVSGLSHDPLQREIFTPLCLGAAICIPSMEGTNCPGSMAGWMRRNEVTVAHLTPGLGQVLSNMSTIDETTRLQSLRYAFFVGDSLTRRDVAALRSMAPTVACINYYGSTETQRSVGYYVISQDTIDSRGGVDGNVRDKDVLPLGKGIEDVQLLVLNARGFLAGMGELGEIYVRSPHLARGYLGDQKLTTERFITNPFTAAPSDRLYRTGDFGRYRTDGNVEFVGRIDRQVKVRGYRIELGEVEAALLSLPGVREAVVVPQGDGPTEKRLIAYIVEIDGKSPTTVGELRARLRHILPDYMVPSVFIAMEALPLTPNGKVDHARLPTTEYQPLLAFIAPTTSTEQAVAEIWAELLKLRHVGRHDNFFELGGHSLLALQMLRHLRAKFGVELELRDLWEASTIAEMASAIEDRLIREVENMDFGESAMPLAESVCER